MRRIGACCQAEEVVLGAIATASLPGRVIDAAREELRRRLDVPRSGLIDQQRQRLQTRLGQLRKQHEWGDITDEYYREMISTTRAELAELPDEDKLVLFDRHRRVIESMRASIETATPRQRQELVRLLVERCEVRDRTVRPRTSSGRPRRDRSSA